MPDLDFSVDGAAPLPYAVTPTLAFKLRITSDSDAEIRGVALDCQIRIEATRRRYDPREKGRLNELFGAPERWSQTVRSLLWTHAHVNVPPFAGGVMVELPVGCTYDFDVVATKYLVALSEGEIPLVLLFSGSIFYSTPDGTLRMARIPWSKEASFGLPVSTWRGLMDTYFPDSAWLRVRKDVFDRLLAYRTRRGALDWDDVIDRLLGSAREVQPR